MRVLVIFTPDRQPGPETGGLLSVLRIQDLLDTVVNTNVAAGYGVAVSEGGEAIFGRSATDTHYRDEWGQSLPLPVMGFEWRLAVWPLWRCARGDTRCWRRPTARRRWTLTPGRRTGSTWSCWT
jgi:hypothetical protein